MIVKNGFNIMLFVIIMISSGIFSCQKGGISHNSDVLLQTDRDFSALSEKEGMFKAFLAFIADDGVILRDNAFPAKGKSRQTATGNLCWTAAPRDCRNST